MLFDCRDPLGAPFLSAVEEVLAATMAARRAEVIACDDALGAVVDTLMPLACGGKHVRAAFVWWGHVSVAGEPEQPQNLLALAASLDLTHAGLLAHDDLIDDAGTRRGQPSAHRAVGALAPDGTGRAAFGLAGAVIGGAWLLQWAQQAADESGYLASPGAAGAFAQLRSQVLTGQMADAWAAAGLPLTGPSGGTPLDAATASAEISDLKTASYTVVGPLLLGAHTAGASPAQLAALTAFARPLGRAYQARDDVLGVFGDEAVTGKPSASDLRLGKVTPLVAAALRLASTQDAASLRAVLGNPEATAEQLATAAGIIAHCGALSAVESAIANGLAESLDALAKADLTTGGRTGLTRLAQVCLGRDR